MKTPAIATILTLSIASPAQAALSYTLPGGYRSLVLKGPKGTPLEARGVYVPVIWFGGPTRFFKLRFEGGGAYLKDAQGGIYSYAVGQAIMNFELPLGPVTPYLGAIGHIAYPFQQPNDVTGFPYGLMPQVGMGLDLGFAKLDLHAASGPVEGLSQPGSGPYQAILTDIGGQLSFIF